MSDKTHLEAAGRILSRAGHDVRGPAGNVVGALDELERSVGAQVAADNAAFFTIARRGLRRLLRLADRYSVISELTHGAAATAVAVDVEELCRGAIAEASFVYGRREVQVASELTALRAPVQGRWMAAALSDALLVALRPARSRVVVRLEARGDLARVTIASDADAAGIEKVWRAALSSDSDLSDESALPVRVIDGVLKAHGGEARVERADERVQIVLEWPLGATGAS